MKSKIYIVCIITLMTLVQACSKMNDLSDKYLDEGEIVYAAKPYGQALSGKNRIEMNIYIAAQRMETVRIYWNNYADSLDVYIGGKTGLFSTMLENMPEGGYIFQLISFDMSGNRSLSVEVTGSSYGDKFQETLSNRGINSIEYFDNKLIINWAGQIDKAVACNLTYTNLSGEEVELAAPISDKSTILTDWKWPTSLRYNTAFLPDSTTIDTFYTEYITIANNLNKIDRKQLSIDSYSSQHDDGNNAAKNAIDGKDATRWHTRAGDGLDHYPHWVIIDLGSTVTVSQFSIWATTFEQSAGQVDKRCPVKIKFEVSTDKTTWIDLGTYSCDNFKLGEQLYPVMPTAARYYRFTGVEGTDNNMVVGELGIYLQ